MNAYNVIHAMPSSDTFRCAVATIIEDIERATQKPLWLIADSIDASHNTLSNAKNKKTDLNATYLARLGSVYGGAFLNPYLALFQTQAQPLPPKPTTDILPVLTGLTHDIAYARSAESPGGCTEVPQERRAYLSKAKTLQREVGCLIREIEAV